MFRLIKHLLIVNERAVDCIILDDFQNPNYYTEITRNVFQITFLISNLLNKPRVMTSYYIEPLLRDVLKITEKLLILSNKLLEKFGMKNLKTTNSLKKN